MPKRLRRLIDFLQKHANAWWYAPAVALLAAADAFVVVVPTDGLLVSACMLAPRRWISTTLFVTLGSALGAWALAAVLETHGLPFLLHLMPGLQESRAWVWSDQMMDLWGGYALFLVSLSPIMQHPAVALASLAGMPLLKIFLVVFAGRLVKYGFLAWLSTHMPGLLKRIWGLEDELKVAGVNTLEEPKALQRPILK